MTEISQVVFEEIAGKTRIIYSLTHSYHIDIISAYAPQVDLSMEEKEDFWVRMI